MKWEEININHTPMHRKGYIREYKVVGRIEDIVYPTEVTGQLRQLQEEYEKASLLRTHGVPLRTKIMLVGESGTGKTMTAGLFASMLGLSLSVVQVESLISSKLGATGTALNELFTHMRENATPTIYFIDEIDSIGSLRGREGEVGEMSRIVNTLLKNLDMLDEVYLLSATNFPEVLDSALLRRYDMVVNFPRPRQDVRELMLKKYLPPEYLHPSQLTALLHSTEGYSQSKLMDVVMQIKRRCVLSNTYPLTTELLQEELEHFQQQY